MKSDRPSYCYQTTWRRRNCYSLGNGLVHLTILMGGGHIAEFRLKAQSKQAGVSPLWIPPWPTIDPYDYQESYHSRRYGPAIEGKLLSGIAGHSLCLDYFGLPSKEEVRQGLSLHGEAPSTRWKKTSISVSKRKVSLTVATQLPLARLSVSRRIELRDAETVAYFEEIVENKKKMDHFFHWAEHVSLGQPFLSSRQTIVTIPGVEALSFPHGYDEGKALLASNQFFHWPLAPLAEGGMVDLSRPFPREGLGFVVAVLVDRNRKLGFVAATNKLLGLIIVYCFRRSDFPWVAVWEENRAIAAVPWKMRTRARGLEFSTTPFPVERREAFGFGKCLGESTLTCVPALGEKAVRYAAFLAPIPRGFGGIQDVEAERDRFIVRGSARKQSIVIAASGIEEFLDLTASN